LTDLHGRDDHTPPFRAAARHHGRVHPPA
jgi:hypothetical protein